MENEIYWRNYYKSRLFREGPSLFSQYVASLFPYKQAIVDVGCGSGRDTLWFSSVGYKSIGFDSSEEAIHQCKERAGRLGSDCEFEILDVGKQSISDAISSRFVDATDLIIYARFFLHAISDKNEQIFLKNISDLVMKGAHLCIEARSIDDQALPKVQPTHFRRFISIAELEMRCLTLSMRLDHMQTGHGLAPYGNEDPAIIRAVFCGINYDKSS